MDWTWKLNDLLTLSQLPAEVDDELQEQQADGQEEQQAKHPER